MKGSDYIADFLVKHGVRHAFGYPGGMVTHLMDSLDQTPGIEAHVMCHEQGAAFAACGYAQATGTPGFAYATSGPGATNLVTGICHAWFDSIPVLFLTGQVNSSELKGSFPIRQKGFQETDIVSMVSGVTKYAKCVSDPDELARELHRAWAVAQSGRKGPVLLDVCMDVMRLSVSSEGTFSEFEDQADPINRSEIAEILKNALLESSRPVVLLGNGVKSAGARNEACKAISELHIPAVTSMVAFDVLGEMPELLGFVGAYGHRVANFAVAKSDLVISIGSRMDIRQVGARREAFAPNARIIRFDIDPGELTYKVHDDELGIVADAKDVLQALLSVAGEKELDFGSWLATCFEMSELLRGIDLSPEGSMIAAIGKYLPNDAIITTDVGQNQVWVSQFVSPLADQNFLFSGGHGAMGYSLPAAIGASLATGRTVVSINGDGGIQMNIQELQSLSSIGCDVKVVIMNNESLGMIRHFQEMYFDSRYVQTVLDGGYVSPNFEALAGAYGIPFVQVSEASDISRDLFSENGPTIIEVKLGNRTHVFPKLEFGKPNQDQEPLLSREFYGLLMDM